MRGARALNCDDGGMPERSHQPVVLVSAVALVDDLQLPTRVLAARRTRPADLAGGWEFPGGKVEPEETSQQAVHREILEELGVRVRLGDRVGPAAWPLSPTAVMDLWWAVVRPGEPAPAPLQDHDQVRWLTREELFEVAWLSADLPIVEHLAGLLHTPRSSPT
ncbi:(deoxy)nucleoside triphosphate pyrophosphohydrolase [Ornithinimicrobium sufpigmenti]|uniref:(deoxy)nucleoside triphosphate pyrophosphohydrolase n=1 Tax=Ornithinimicrobium sufpigmenti TaxID=2508882 RepID=UPI001EDE47BD|nr:MULTISPECIES: (deoxy)nucleoside triphosphate pyrophosphohydrolase [unclassified Ornithinimicrobium]